MLYLQWNNKDSKQSMWLWRESNCAVFQSQVFVVDCSLKLCTCVFYLLSQDREYSGSKLYACTVMVVKFYLITIKHLCHCSVSFYFSIHLSLNALKHRHLSYGCLDNIATSWSSCVSGCLLLTQGCIWKRLTILFAHLFTYTAKVWLVSGAVSPAWVPSALKLPFVKQWLPA